MRAVVGTNVSTDAPSFSSTVRREGVTLFGLQGCDAGPCGKATKDDDSSGWGSDSTGPQEMSAVVGWGSRPRPVSPGRARYERRRGQDSDGDTDGVARGPLSVSMD